MRRKCDCRETERERGGYKERGGVEEWKVGPTGGQLDGRDTFKDLMERCNCRLLIVVIC